MKLADEIVIDNQGGRILIDGSAFPFFILRDPGIDVRDSYCVVTLEVITDSVQVVGKTGLKEWFNRTDGDVRAWARETGAKVVKNGMADILEWLGIDEVD